MPTVIPAESALGWHGRCRGPRCRRGRRSGAVRRSDRAMTGPGRRAPARSAGSAGPSCRAAGRYAGTRVASRITASWSTASTAGRSPRHRSSATGQRVRCSGTGGLVRAVELLVHAFGQANGANGAKSPSRTRNDSHKVQRALSPLPPSPQPVLDHLQVAVAVDGPEHPRGGLVGLHVVMSPRTPPWPRPPCRPGARAATGPRCPAPPVAAPRAAETSRSPRFMGRNRPTFQSLTANLRPVLMSFSLYRRSVPMRPLVAHSRTVSRRTWPSRRPARTGCSRRVHWTYRDPAWTASCPARSAPSRRSARSARAPGRTAALTAPPNRTARS